MIKALDMIFIILAKIFTVMLLNVFILSTIIHTDFLIMYLFLTIPVSLGILMLWDKYGINYSKIEK